MNRGKTIKLVGIDLDGTLLRNDKSVSEADLTALEKLGDRNIVRIAATGRNLYKVNEVLKDNLPIDYIVFSSGCGIYDWKTKDILKSYSFNNKTIAQLCDYLLALKVNFLVFHDIPNNNKFWFSRGSNICPEFESYLNRHIGDHKPLNKNIIPSASSQIIVVVPNDNNAFAILKSQIEENCQNVKIIRTTSPVDKRFLWLEIFPIQVSKGNGLKWLCDKLYIDYSNTLGIGNDYNDLDMFEFVAHPYVLGNGVEELKEKYKTVSSTNEENGVSSVVNIYFDLDK